MNDLSRRMPAAFLALAMSLSVTCVHALANGSTGPTEVAKYFNPFQKKHGDLNKSQDRVIKKKSFKADKLPDLGAQPAVNRELGFFGIVSPDKLNDTNAVSQMLDDARVNGLSATIPWSLVEPKEDEINWQPVDQLLELCKKSGKTLILRISTAGIDLPSGPDAKTTVSDTPKWVFDAGAPSITFESPDGKRRVMPIFWDKTYMGKWSNFLREFASRYDKNPNIHSIGITGGGFEGSTSVLPSYDAKVADENEKGGYSDLEKVLKDKYGMTQRQLVEHWKYIADIFPKRFTTARLNFDINAPVPHRYGEDALDEISDYLVYKYGERVYLTRQAVTGKHGFDDYRVLIKFRNDTLTGVQLRNDVAAEDLDNISKHALDDGISYAELPASVLSNLDQPVQSALKSWSEHIGYQIINTKAAVQDKLGLGEPLKAQFEFVNVGAASALRPEHIPNFDKDTAASYRVMIELRDSQGKPVLQNVHTPPTPTTKWMPGQPVAWEQELKMIDADKHQLPPGEYTAFMSLVDTASKRKIAFLNATSGETPSSTDTVAVGKIVIVSTPIANDKEKLETSSTNQGGQQ